MNELGDPIRQPSLDVPHLGSCSQPGSREVSTHFSLTSTSIIGEEIGCRILRIYGTVLILSVDFNTLSRQETLLSVFSKNLNLALSVCRLLKIRTFSLNLALLKFLLVFTVVTDFNNFIFLAPLSRSLAGI
jgi:hypothetical protein